MKVRLNDKELELHTSSSLTQLMTEHQLYHDSGIAVAVNEEIIPKTNWDTYQVQDNDNILIITATQGG